MSSPILPCNKFEIFDYAFSNLTNSSLPHVSECLQHSWLLYIPSLFLIIFTPLVLYSLYKSNNGPLECCSPITLRIALCIYLLINVGIFQAYGLYKQYEFENANLDEGDNAWNHVVLYFALAVAFVLTVASRNRGLITSGVLFNFWLLLAICGFPEFRYKLSAYFFLQEEDKANFDYVKFALYTAFYPAVILELILCCFADVPKYQIFDKKFCPELNSSFLNQITFNWFTGMAVKGYNGTITMNDLWDLNHRDSSKHLLKKFLKHWEPHVANVEKSSSSTAKSISLQINNTKDNEESKILQTKGSEPEAKEDPPSILFPLYLTFKKPFIAGALYKLCFDVLLFVSPQLLHYLISFVEDPSQPMWFGITISLLLFVVALVQSMIVHQYFHNMFRLGMNIRSVLTSVVYRKALYLSNNAKKNRTLGEIVNLMAVDIQRLQDLTTFIMLFWSSPLQIIGAIFFLCRLLGVAVIGGLAVLLLLVPFNYFITVKMKNYQVQQMKYKDERLKMTNEALNGIKVLKLYAWEASMKKMILDIRKKELIILRTLAFFNSVTSLTWSCAPFLVAVVTFGTYIAIDPENNILTPQVTFVALSLFNILRFPLAIVSMIMGQAVQAHVSNQRLKSFLADEEIEGIRTVDGIKSNIAVEIQNGNFYWDQNDLFQLHDINLKIKKGSLVAIVGRIGSGKSSLLSAILNEMQTRDGAVAVSGSIAYVPQQPWIQNISMKKNVLFNQAFHERLYNNVISSCALEPDIKNLPAGDETEIGEKGINLSGGQKQRVSLARAIYCQKDVYLLDDPLSAVDAHVGKHLFENVISSQTGLLKYQTRIFVTHGLHYLKHCDQIVVMKEGRISECGSYVELLSNAGEFAEILEECLINEAKNRARSVSFGEDEAEVKEFLERLEKIEPGKKSEIERQISESIDKNAKADYATPPEANEKVSDEALLLPKEPAKPPQAKLMAAEQVETGKVKFNVYMTYIRAIGCNVVLLFFIIYIISSILGVISNLYLADWSNHAKEIQMSGDNATTSSNTRLGIYTALGIAQALSVCMASIWIALGMVKGSRILHEKMLTNILRSPMNFFDVTPLGRVLNRFGKDIENIDTAIPRSFVAFVRTAVASLEIIVVICFSTYQFVLPMAIFALVYFLILRFYVNTSRQLKRLESVTRSPIYSHFQESIQGAASIRAFRATDSFLLESQKRVDYNLVAYYPSIVANRWLAVRLEAVGNCIVLLSALLAAYFRESVTAGLVGLSVSYAFNITQTLNWAVRMTSELETNVVAVERIKEYAETPTEAAVETAARVKLPREWPVRGSINFEDLEIRYRPDLETVLNGINAHVSSEEKIGIVGRTGAGKSSLVVALFRLVEPSSGKILIDGVDIAQIGLNDLRSRLTIVPQDPVLFSGTLRSNLDPFNKYKDEELWQVLKLTHMDTFINSLTDRLDHKISEGGENLSVGQRQLICLARALLRKSKVLILDEAAASVDLETDHLIQTTIKEQFADCTVLTIAHRLNSVLNSNRVMVMDKGQVVEFDAPQTLLKNSESSFHKLAMDAGFTTD